MTFGKVFKSTPLEQQQLMECSETNIILHCWWQRNHYNLWECNLAVGVNVFISLGWVIAFLRIYPKEIIHKFRKELCAYVSSLPHCV